MNEKEEKPHSPPPAPVGKQDPEPYGETSTSKRIWIIVISLILTIPFLVSYLPKFEPTIPAVLEAWGPIPGGALLFATLYITYKLTLYLHEYTHAVVQLYQGYSPSIRWNDRNPKVVNDGEFVPRNDRIVQLIAPFLGLTPIFIVLQIINSWPLVEFALILAIWLNAIPSGGDLYGVFRLLRLPPKTVTVTMWEELRETYIYKPE